MDNTVQNNSAETNVIEQIFKDLMIGLGWILLNAFIFVMVYQNLLVPGYIDTYPISDMTKVMVGEEIVIEELVNQLAIDHRGRVYHERSFIWGVIVGVWLLWSTSAAQRVRGFFRFLDEWGNRADTKKEGSENEGGENVQESNTAVDTA